MSGDIQIDGLAELEKALLDLGAEVGFKTLRSAGREAMKPVLNTAQQLVHQDSGDTHDALGISARRGKGNTAVNINVGVTRNKASKAAGGRKLNNVNQKAIALEFGNSRQRAYPFLRPALNHNAVKVLNRFQRALKDKIERAARKAKK